jgi:cysteine desulfuration protein SufE
MLSINQVQDEIIEDFAQFDDWMDKYALLIDLGNGLEPINDQYKVPQNIIEGCQSRVWLTAELDGEGIITYKAESDAILVKGIVALLLRVFSGRTPDEILNADLYFVEKIGLREHLSPTRSNGLLAMIKQIKLYALAYKSKMG